MIMTAVDDNMVTGQKILHATDEHGQPPKIMS